uniref:Uncharacterized protein n=1 Tax=Utricularia reniformis TaxID=192314 RepID=A0A1Y0B2V1_9LAMI|nr:hypothetical protein AEK19_MT1528 [Utricularia reniformis]ART31717.1 hypothetical protein AEK19_MT1528 [Utricularia reniformis]
MFISLTQHSKKALAAARLLSQLRKYVFFSSIVLGC